MSAMTWVLNGSKTREDIYDGVLAALQGLNRAEGFRFQQLQESMKGDRLSVEFASEVPGRILVRLDFDLGIESATMTVATRDAVTQAALRAAVDEMVGIETAAALTQAVEQKLAPRELYRFAAVAPDCRKPQVAAILRRALDSDVAEVRRAGVISAAVLGAAGLKDRVETLANKDDDPQVRTAAQAAIEQFGRHEN